MPITLDSPARKRAFQLGLLAVTATYLVLVTTQFVADWMGSRPYLGSLRLAVKLDPGNADYHSKLGRYYELVARDPFAALEQYEDAVRLNPHQSEYLLDLADGYQLTGDVASQANAIEQAVRADPRVREVYLGSGAMFAA